MAKQYNDYTDDDRAAVLAHYETSKSLRATAAAFDIPHQVVHLWSKKEAASPETRQEKRRELSDVFEDIAYQASEQVRNTMELAKPGEAATIAAIAVDKMRLLRGESTSISQSISTPEERDKKLVEIVERAKLRLVG